MTPHAAECIFCIFVGAFATVVIGIIVGLWSLRNPAETREQYDPEAR